MLEELRKMQTDRPFRPFRIRMNDGETYGVRHPEMCMITAQTVYLGEPTDAEVPERARWLHVRNIASVEHMEETNV